MLAALILVPTRELALQTSQVCKELGKHLGVEVMVTTGGTLLKDDIMRLHQPVHILVATPGRLLDLANRRLARLDKCSTLVMDEACSFRDSRKGLTLFSGRQASLSRISAAHRAHHRYDAARTANHAVFCYVSGHSKRYLVLHAHTHLLTFVRSV